MRGPARVADGAVVSLVRVAVNDDRLTHVIGLRQCHLSKILTTVIEHAYRPSMNLADYLAMNRLSQSECARAVECDPAVISRFLAGQRGLSLRVAVAIEQWSHGQVTTRELSNEGAGNGAQAEV